MVRVLAADDVAELLDLEALVDVTQNALVDQSRGRVERPDRPHYPVGIGLAADGSGASTNSPSAEPLGTGLAMPAYVHGSPYSATKLATVHEGNTDLPTVHAQIVLASAETGRPVAFLEGTTITNARTGCIGAVSVRALADGPITLGVFGAGTQARWQTRAIGAAVDVESVRVYSPSDSKRACAADLRERGFDARATDTPEETADADVVVTATTSREPVFPADALADDAIVVAVGAYTDEMCELDPRVLDRAGRIYADVPEEVAEIGEVVASERGVDELIPLGALLDDDRPNDGPIADGPAVVESVGSAVLDAAAAESIYGRALDGDVGTDVAFE
ncbi:ornithine cyclodeaminase family protein [Halovivax gelatinilyticus]|uniref:ornithine cyclodeaminase family protein n=1 Tax=Halovivax gelatinilyticus TaxID=2961597 RepID=UPI0020CA9153|nr:ornithine cyclodeaminase family protein [Halovivax gelatinilyticus]